MGRERGKYQVTPPPVPAGGKPAASGRAGPGGRLRRLRHLIVRCVEVCVFVMFMTFTLTTLIAVFNRFVLNDSIVEAEELIRYAMVWMTMLAAPLVTDEGGHLNGSLMGFVKSRLAATIERVAIHGGIAAFAILLVWSSWDLICNTITQSPALGVNMGVAYAAMLAGGILELLIVLLEVLAPASRQTRTGYFE